MQQSPTPATHPLDAGTIGSAPPMSPISSEEGEVGAVAPELPASKSHKAAKGDDAPHPSGGPGPIKEEDVGLALGDLRDSASMVLPSPASHAAPAKPVAHLSADQVLAELDRLEKEGEGLVEEAADVEAELQRLRMAEPRLAELLAKVEDVPPVPPEFSDGDASEEPLSSDSEGDVCQEADGEKERGEGGGRGRRKRGRPKKGSKAAAGAGDGKSVAEEEAVLAAVVKPALPPAQRWLSARLGQLTAAAVADDVTQSILCQSKDLGAAARAQFASLMPDSLLTSREGSVIREPSAHGAPDRIAELLATPLASGARASPGITTVLEREFRAMLTRHLEAAVEYRARYERWRKRQLQKERAVMIGNSPEVKRTGSTMSGRGAAAGSGEPTSPSVGRVSSRGRRDVVRSDLEERLAIATMQAIDALKKQTEVR